MSVEPQFLLDDIPIRGVWVDDMSIYNQPKAITGLHRPQIWYNRDKSKFVRYPFYEVANTLWFDKNWFLYPVKDRLEYNRRRNNPPTFVQYDTFCAICKATFSAETIRLWLDVAKKRKHYCFDCEPKGYQRRYP